MPASSSDFLAQLLEANAKGGGRIIANHGDFSDVNGNQTNITYGSRPSDEQISSSQVASTGLNLSHTHFGSVMGNSTTLNVPDARFIAPAQLQQLVHQTSTSTNVHSTSANRAEGSTRARGGNVSLRLMANPEPSVQDTEVRRGQVEHVFSRST